MRLGSGQKTEKEEWKCLVSSSRITSFHYTNLNKWSCMDCQNRIQQKLWMFSIININSFTVKAYSQFKPNLALVTLTVPSVASYLLPSDDVYCKCKVSLLFSFIFIREIYIKSSLKTDLHVYKMCVSLSASKHWRLAYHPSCLWHGQLHHSLKKNQITNYGMEQKW